MEKPQKKGIADTFNDDELITILEFARLAISDANFFDEIIEKTDISDEEMIRLREKLQSFMECQSAPIEVG
jgi:hypothetical protein